MKAQDKMAYIMVGLVAALLVVAWYFLLLSPMRSSIGELDEQISQTQSTLAQTHNQVVRYEAYKKTAPQSRAEVVRLSKMIPESEGIPSLIVELTQTAKASGVEVVSITRGETEVGKPFGLQVVTLEVTGRYFDVEDFLYRLENYVASRNESVRVTGRLLQVTNLTLAGSTSSTATTSSSPPLTVSITLNGYMWAGPGSAAGATTPTAATPTTATPTTPTTPTPTTSTSATPTTPASTAPTTNTGGAQ